jgi:endonuclease/exonuclease/phosphatase family metal-dependent hydrolase
VVAALDAAIPAKQLDRNLLLASWNIRGFGDVTEKWRSEENDSPKRDLFDVRCIAEIVSRFDVVAIQEARGDLSSLRAMLQVLGEDWALIATDVTRGRAGNNERMLFVFDRRRIRPSGLAGELVVALEEDTPVEATGLDKQFARTPYAVSFEASSRAFTLVTLHVIYGNAPADRVDELKEIATWLADWPKREKEWSENLLTLGDFNIDRPRRPALGSTHLHRAEDTTSSKRRSPHDLPRPAGPPLLRPDRLVRGEQHQVRPQSRLHDRGKLRLRPVAPSRADHNCALLAYLRPLPALGRVFSTGSQLIRGAVPLAVPLRHRARLFLGVRQVSSAVGAAIGQKFSLNLTDRFSQWDRSRGWGARSSRAPPGRRGPRRRRPRGERRSA